MVRVPGTGPAWTREGADATPLAYHHLDFPRPMYGWRGAPASHGPGQGPDVPPGLGHGSEKLVPSGIDPANTQQPEMLNFGGCTYYGQQPAPYGMSPQGWPPHTYSTAQAPSTFEGNYSPFVAATRRDV